MSGANDKTAVLAEEYLHAVEQMSPRERDLSSAVIAVNDDLAAAIELLGLLTDESAAGFDLAHAIVAEGVSRMLRETFTTSYAAHAAFVARVSGPGLH